MPVLRRVRQRRFFGEAEASQPKEDNVTMKDSHAGKGAKNQAIIREVNERIEQLADDAAHPEFLCECADTNCVETIEAPIAEYEALRSSPVQFLVKPGHDYPEFERVVEENENYAVVEKFGEAARIVKKIDPRSRATSGFVLSGVGYLSWTWTQTLVAKRCSPFAELSRASG